METLEARRQDELLRGGLTRRVMQAFCSWWCHRLLLLDACPCLLLRTPSRLAVPRAENHAVVGFASGLPASPLGNSESSQKEAKRQPLQEGTASPSSNLRKWLCLCSRDTGSPFRNLLTSLRK